MYKIKMMGGETFVVTVEEYQAIIKSTAPVFLSRLEVYLNKNSISTAYPENIADKTEDRKNRQQGVLHDGTRVRRHFGQWVDGSSSVPSMKETGDYIPVIIDPTYYPEVARDCVPSPEEYAAIAHLPTAERKALILKGTSERRGVGTLEKPDFTKLIE